MFLSYLTSNPHTFCITFGSSKLDDIELLSPKFSLNVHSSPTRLTHITYTSKESNFYPNTQSRLRVAEKKKVSSYIKFIGRLPNV